MHKEQFYHTNYILILILPMIVLFTVSQHYHRENTSFCLARFFSWKSRSKPEMSSVYRCIYFFGHRKRKAALDSRVTVLMQDLYYIEPRCSCVIHRGWTLCNWVSFGQLFLRRTGQSQFPQIYWNVIWKRVWVLSLRRVSIVTAQVNKQITCGYNWFLFIKLKVTVFWFN